MPIEAHPNSPPLTHPRVEDSAEHSFAASLHRAVETLFTYHDVATTFQEAPQDEDTAQFIELWKQGIATHLEQTAAAAVSSCLNVFAQFKSGQLVTGRSETPGIDPYKIAEAACGARIDELQKSGGLRKPSEITELYVAEDHFDESTQVFKETCLAMGLAWLPPYSNAENVPEER